MAMHEDLLQFFEDDSEHSSDESQVVLNPAAGGPVQPGAPGRTPPAQQVTPRVQIPTPAGAGRIHRPVYQLDKFSGKENLNDWNQDWDRACLINGWARSARSLLLPTYFTGRALTYFNSLDVATRASASKTLDAMHAHFDSAAVRHQAKTMAAERAQKHGESVSDYFTALSALTRKAFGHLDKEIEREKLKDLFVQGLRPNLRKVFWSKDPVNIESALLEAENKEAYLKSKKKLGLSAEANVVDQGGPSHTKRDDKYGNISNQLVAMQQQFCTFREDMEKELKKRDQQMEELKTLVKSLSVSPKPISAPTASPSSYTCWGCGESGHVRSSCPKRSKPPGNQ